MTVEKFVSRTECGWGPLRCCQRLARPEIVVFFVGFAAFINKMVVSGFITVGVTSLEKRFNLSSQDMGLIISSAEIASLVCLLPVGYLGGRGSKPRWVGGGVLLMALGSFVFALPHFFTGLYRYNDTEDDVFCDLSSNSTSTDSCNSNDDSLSNYKYVLILGQLLTGAGTAPLISIALAYIDENVHPNKSPIFIGIIFAFVLFGAACGYLIGGYFIGIYTDFDRVNTNSVGITPDSEAWVGAWWVGPLIGSAMALLCALPIYGFPKKLPGWEKLEGMKNQEVHNGSNETTVMGAGLQSLSELPAALKSLLTNPAFVFFSIGGASENFLIFAISSFGLKYVEAQFSLSATRASFIIGSVTIVCAASGAITGGYIVKRRKLKVQSIIKLIIGVCVVTLLSYLSLLIRCKPVDFAGVSVGYDGRSFKAEHSKENSDLEAQCNAACGCAFDRYDPVCSEDKVIYANPCAAGCPSDSHNKVYSNCSCVDTGEVKEGICDSGCDMAYLFIALNGVTVLLSFFTMTILMTVTIRCVAESQRSFGLSIYNIISRAFGAIPGPIVFGAILDNSCVFWLTPACSDNAACYYYDNTTMGLYLLVGSLGVKFVSVVVFTAALCFYKPPPEMVKLEYTVT